MTPPKDKSSWDFKEFLKWLNHHPEALEPGLRMLEHGLDLGVGTDLDACGVDGLGRPCLILHIEKFQAQTYDRILLLVARMQADGDRFRNLFERPNEPRLFLLATGFPAEVRERLALLAQAFPLRGFRVGPPASGRSTPSIELEEIVVEEDPLLNLEDLEPDTQAPFARRLLHACVVLHPPIRCRGGDWPLLLQGTCGPIATLLLSEDGLHYAIPGQLRGSPLLPLHDDEAVDVAIDHLLRAQEKSESSAA